jgi:hypothetical protein
MSERVYRSHTIEMVLRAEQPIAHHEGAVGNEAVVMRETVFGPTGRKTRVPIVTGDTIRHGLREASARATLEAAGLLDAVHGESALRLMFAGGSMTKGADALRLDEYREMVELFPPLALLGGCAGNRIVPGQIEVGRAYLICEESAHLMPEWVSAWMDELDVERNAARAHIERVQRVRMDPMLRPETRSLLSADARAEVEGRLLRSDSASANEDDAEATKSKSAMLPFAYETIAAGSLFFVRIHARTTTLIESDTLHVMLAAWLARPMVGGKRGTGHGLLRLVECRGMQRVEMAPSESDALSFGASSPEVERFRAHVAERAERLGVWLGKVAA